MSLTKKSAAGGLGITCRELSVLEIRDWMKSLAQGVDEPDPVGDTLIEAVSLADLMRMSDATPEQLDSLAPSQLRVLAADCKEVNRDFFALRERLEGMGKHLLGQLSDDSNATPAP